MKAAVKVGPEKFEIRNVPVPDIGEKNCLVKVSYCATCVWCYEEWMRDGTDDIFGPGVTGHEMSGVVVKTGTRVTKWKEGDKVLTYFKGHCGICPECMEGKEMYCTGAQKPGSVIKGYAEYISVPEQCLLLSPDGIDLKYAGLITDMVGTSMHAIRRAFSVGIERKVVAIWGLGPIGLFTVQGVKTFSGVEKIIAISHVKYRREIALKLGANEILDPSDADFEKKLHAENGGRGINYFFNCSNRNTAAIDIAFKALKLDGYLMNITGEAKSGLYCEKRIDGTCYFFKKEYEENVKLVMDGKIKLEPILTHEFPLDEINEAMIVRSKHQDTALKVTIKCT